MQLDHRYLELDHRYLERYPRLIALHGSLIGELRSSAQHKYPSCYHRGYSALTALPWVHPDRTEHWDWYYATLHRQAPELAAETLQSVTDALYVAYTSPLEPMYALLSWVTTSLWAKSMVREWAMFATEQEPVPVWAVCLAPVYGKHDPYHRFEAVSSKKGVSLEREDATRQLFALQMSTDWRHVPDETPKGPAGGRAGEVVYIQHLDSQIHYDDPMGGVIQVMPWQMNARRYNRMRSQFPWWGGARGGLYYLQALREEPPPAVPPRSPAAQRRREREICQKSTLAPPISRFQMELLVHEGLQSVLGALQGVPDEEIREHLYYVHEKFKALDS